MIEPTPDSTIVAQALATDELAETAIVENE
jgi:hypothetical protein